MKEQNLNFYEAARVCGFETMNRAFARLLREEILAKRITPCLPPDGPDRFTGDGDVHPSNLNYDPHEIQQLAGRCSHTIPPSETRA